ncbi:hypothetical protein [Ammoniphilus sp. 3BR4]|uniref:hypothetical protein n=1 Tax=Ammoniphilus sp. 3BR4 TaxID=3158265 RepID=UPI003465DEB4
MDPDHVVQPHGTAAVSGKWKRLGMNGLLLTLTLLAFLVIALSSVRFGVADLTSDMVMEAIMEYDPNIQQHQIVHDLRIPRVLAAAISLI